MSTRADREARSNVLALAKSIKSIRSYVDDGVGWVEVVFEGNRELALRFEVGPVVVKRGLLSEYRDGNWHLIKRFSIARGTGVGEGR
jgi:hypothetical protein